MAETISEGVDSRGRLPGAVPQQGGRHCAGDPGSTSQWAPPPQGRRENLGFSPGAVEDRGVDRSGGEEYRSRKDHFGCCPENSVKRQRDSWGSHPGKSGWQGTCLEVVRRGRF